MNISTFKLSFCTALGLLGSFISRLFGGWTEDMVTLVIFMAVDFLMGLIVAGVFHNSDKSKSGALNSRAGWMGLCKKGMILIFVLVAHRMDVLLEVSYIKITVIVGFIANEAISIIENAGLMGIPLPEIIKKAVDILKDRERDANEHYKEEL